jgi:hypothetical protein
VQEENAEGPIEVMPFGIVRDMREVQPKNMEEPMDVMLSGIFTETREGHI